MSEDTNNSELAENHSNGEEGKINDVLHRFIFDNTDIRGEIVSLDESFRQAFKHQNFHASLRAVFGEFLAGAALLSEVLKFEGTLTLQAKGSGPVNLIMAEASDKGEIRGIIRLLGESEAQQDFSQMKLSDLVGEGILTITIDPEKGHRYQGIIPLDQDTLALCLEQYFSQSEQLPTDISLFATDEQCGGLFLQCLPAQEIKDQETRDERWEMATHLASTLTAKELFSLANTDILYRLFHELSCRVFDPKHVKFKCSCSRDRSANAIQSIGKTETQHLLLERGVIKIDCQFCGQQYQFTDNDVELIFPDESKPLH